MKSLLFLVSLAAVGTLCSAQTPGYTLQGTVPDATYNGQTVYLTEYEGNSTLDSTTVRDGKFTFKRDDAGFRRLNLGRKYANIIAEPGTITVNMENPKLVGGTPLNDSIARLSAAEQNYYTEDTKLWDDSTLTQAEKLARFQVSQKEYLESVIASYKANKDNLFGASALWGISYDMKPELFLAYFKEGGTAVRDFAPLKNIKAFKEALIATAPGKMFADFEGTDSTGRAVKFSDYAGKGKYVLVDFWASWCGPCRAETPVVAKAYEKYKDKGLEVMGLFVWDKAKNLGKAVQELHITWPQIIDSNNITRDLYGVQGIPHIMLIGPDGSILARGLRGGDIEAEIAKHIQ